ncbi:MAG TPA: glycine C-acetyltransferase [Casimicrobiaceae bacterium]|nr:glycine C-acetyltransferase [Casimicrobiaceae bacterium]
MPASDRTAFYADLGQRLEQMRASGLYKTERVLVSRQGPEVMGDDGVVRINLCSNNYLGLSGDDDLVEAGIETLKAFGYGLSSVRFICGTQSIHKALESRLAAFVGTEDAILYAAAFDANGGLFECLLDDGDAVISDELNHASIIDGIRLCRAQRFRYAHDDMADLGAKLEAAASCRYRIIATDGVFSMDGTIARLDAICDLADRHGALVMVDDSHATGFMGRTGRGTHEHHGVMARVDIVTGTLGKALGGAMGGFTAGRKAMVDVLRQRSRPYLFSNSLAPVIVGTSLHVLDRLTASTALRDRLFDNAARVRAALARMGYTLKPGTHPIIPVMVFEAPLAQQLADSLYRSGVLVSGFFHPVVPLGQARVRVQVSAAHTGLQLDRAMEAFAAAGRELGILRPGGSG